MFNANIELLLLPSGPRVVAVKLIHTVNDSSNRLRVAAQVGQKLGLTVNKFGRFFFKLFDHLVLPKDGWSSKPPRLEGPEPTNCQSLLHCRRGEFFLHFVSSLSPALLCPQTEVASRVLAVCKAFDKIAADQLNVDSHFIKVGYLGS